MIPAISTVHREIKSNRFSHKLQAFCVIITMQVYKHDYQCVMEIVCQVILFAFVLFQSLHVSGLRDVAKGFYWLSVGSIRVSSDPWSGQRIIGIIRSPRDDSWQRGYLPSRAILVTSYWSGNYKRQMTTPSVPHLDKTIHNIINR
jgi:hypothetical protein